LKYIDAWQESGKSTVGRAYNFKAGQPIQVKLEYYQENTDGNPSVALLWSLLPSQSSDSITPAINEIATADAVVVLVGGANNDQTATTEGVRQNVSHAYLVCLPKELCLSQEKVWTVRPCRSRCAAIPPQDFVVSCFVAQLMNSRYPFHTR
jgi:hypothetical protein